MADTGRRRAYAEARKAHGKLLDAEADFNGTVSVSCDDGSFFLFRRAFARKLDDEWLAVFTELHGFHVFATADVNLSQLGAARAGAHNG